MHMMWHAQATFLALAACKLPELGRNSRIRQERFAAGRPVIVCGLGILMSVFKFAEKYWQPDEPDRRTLGQGGASDGVER